MKKLFKLSLRATMIIIISLATVVISYYNVRDLVDSFKTEHNRKMLKELVLLSKSLSALIHETQKERGASAGYLGSKGKEFGDILQKQKIITNMKINEYEKILSRINLNKYDMNLKKEISLLNDYLKKLNIIRNKVQNFKISLKDEVKWYTNMNETILKIIGQTSRLAPNKQIAMDLAAYVSFLKAKERAGIERAILSAVFGANNLKKECS